MDPLISIIVPVYQAERYLEKCIDSILSQTLRSFELILINDGSPDNSGKMCDSFAEKDERIKVIHKQNSGPAATRNVGIKLARGAYIGFVDADDYIEPDMYEKLYKAADTFDAEVVICNSVVFSADYSQISRHGLIANERLDHLGIRCNIIRKYYDGDNAALVALHNKLYKTAFIRSNKLFLDEQRVRAEDYWFNMEAYRRASAVVAIDAALYHYRSDNPQSVMKMYRDNQFVMFLKTRKKLLELNRDEFGFEIDYNAFDQGFILETSSHIIQTIRKQKKFLDGWAKVGDIIANADYAAAIRACSALPLHLRLINGLIMVRQYFIAYCLYRLWAMRY